MSTIMAGNLLSLDSGGDTTLKGAVASGKQVVADAGGDLNLESLQDTSTYRSRDQSVGGSVTVGYGFSASANYSQSKIDSDYAGVLEQSGIKAGDGGFQVDVKGHTDLKGAVIESSQSAVDRNKNTFSTGSLSTSDIQNHAHYDAESFSLGGGYTSNNYSLVKPDGSRATPATSGVGTDLKGQAQTGSQTP